jgi:hypothetical protein
MANPEHLKILRQGVAAWNRWRETLASDEDYLRPDLSNVNLFGAKLSKANLTSVDLSGAYLRDANLNFAGLQSTRLAAAILTDAKLIGANLLGANLSGANLRKARLDHADLSAANLREAGLQETSLSDADLTRADLKGADLTNATAGRNLFVDVDLSEVKGLETLGHTGPSTIGIDTLYRSGGKIPESFLRGCGVPEDFITFIPSLIGAQQAIQFYSCFISYSSKDEEFARRLYSRMRDEKLRVWFAPEDIKGGEKLHEQLERAIQLHDRLLIILSENSTQSEWVVTELRKARKQEIQQGRRKLFPIRLVSINAIREWECFDADSGKDLAVEIREYFIPDFSNWKVHDSFEASFDRLLKDLRAAEAS